MNIVLKIAEYVGHAGFAGFLALCLFQPETALWSLLVGWVGYSIARFSLTRKRLQSIR